MNLYSKTSSNLSYVHWSEERKGQDLGLHLRSNKSLLILNTSETPVVRKSIKLGLNFNIYKDFSGLYVKRITKFMFPTRQIGGTFVCLIL